MMLFERGTDLFKVRQMVAERVAVAATHAAAAGRRRRSVMPPLSSTSRVLHIGLTPKRKDELKPGEPQLDADRSLGADEVGDRAAPAGGAGRRQHLDLWPARQAVPGAGQAGRPARPRRHARAGQAGRRRTRVVYGSAGFHDTPNQRLAVQYSTTHRPARRISAQIVVAHRNGAPILLRPGGRR